MPVTQHEIFLIDTGERYRCRSDQTVLAGMETLGRRGIPVGCRQGGCGVCKVEVLSGQFTARPMSQDHVSREDVQAGRVLACRIYPVSDLSVKVLGKMKKTVCAPPAVPRQAAEQT
jgi:ferredoxin